ncbi:glycosyltransferase family 2 protein [Ilumatobacter sp.]|uniref:glycosyltransferase family 2 protein n=1 Tax=Ilumatobacter sp. TaxID=1967498 RepID=UPI003B522DBE
MILDTDLAVVIPHHDDVERLERCLRSLEAPRARNRGVEVVVIDNASTVDLAEVRASFPWVRFDSHPDPGPGNARNRGVEVTSAGVVAFLDCDCVASPDWLDEIRAHAHDADVLGGEVAMFDEGAGPRTGSQAFETVFAFDQRRYVEREGFTVTANMVTSRRVFDAVGGFEPGLGTVSEDAEWCRRATAIGYSLRYVPSMVVAHPTRGDWGALRAKFWRITTQLFHAEPATAARRVRWAARAVLVLGSIGVDGWTLLRSDRLDDRVERARGVVALARIRALRAWWMVRQSVDPTFGMSSGRP